MRAQLLVGSVATLAACLWLSIVCDSAAAQQSTCSPWEYSSADTSIEFQQCQYVGGGSGFYRWRNNHNYDVHIYFRIEGMNGGVINGGTYLPAQSETAAASCFSCGSRNGGLRSWQLTRIVRI
jgi:hypothetical protein